MKKLGLSLLLVTTILFAKEPQNFKQIKPQQHQGMPNSTLMNINNISAWYTNTGEMEREPGSGNSGLTFPRSTATAIYTSGLLWGGIADDGINQLARVNGSSYNNGMVAGAILGIRTGIIENFPDTTEVRIARIRREYAFIDLKQDAAEYYLKSLATVTPQDIATLRMQYRKDWEKWPASKGAPYYDRNNNGVYDPKFIVNDKGIEYPDPAADEPGIANADQVIWYVANDIGALESPWKSKPLGIEMQATFWAYNQSGQLGNVIFKKFKLIYKGTDASKVNSVINNMYITHWSDADVGDAVDDFAGCDTVLGLGYVYNSKTLDKEYRKYNIAPPSVGYDFLQGPIVKTGNPTDKAVFNLKYQYGAKNLPMTSFIYFAGGGRYSDPPFSAFGAIQWYHMMRGLPPTPTGLPDPPMIINPKTGLPTPFWLSGDPVSGNGWVDGVLEGPGDRRMLQTSGPFNMALGDTQEVVVATVCGLGSDRLRSIEVMKYNDRAVQPLFDNLFDGPKPPVTLNYKVTELDKGIILDWENDPAMISAIENVSLQGFKFEGYNVYQMPSPTSPLSEAKRLKTFDLLSDPTTIAQEEFDSLSGLVLIKPVQYGKNSGVKRYIYITQDALKNQPLINGEKYYFAVTSYNYNGDKNLVVHSFESVPFIKTAIPHVPTPGQILPYNINDTIRDIPLTNIVGENDAPLSMVVFNPTLQSGNTYDIWYGGDGETRRNATMVKPISGTEYATVTSTIRDTNEVPRLTTFSSSKAIGTFTINDAKTQITYSVIYDSLSSVPTTASGIYFGAKGRNGNLAKTLTFTGKETKGVWSKNDVTQPLTDFLVTMFTAGNLYVNLMTAAKPTGEIRGQISDGIFPRKELSYPSKIPAQIMEVEEIRIQHEGVNFYLDFAPLGPKSVVEIPSLKNLLNNPSSDGIFSIAGPLSSLIGAKQTNTNVEIRFNNGLNYAMMVPRDSPNLIPPYARFIKVPFAVYKDTTRVWAVVVNDSATNWSTKTLLDSVWNVNPLNGTINGKPVFDAIYGIANDSADGGVYDMKYYSPSNTVFPPTSNGVKSRILNGVNHILSNVLFVSEKGDGTVPTTGTIVHFTMYKSIQIGDIKSFTIKKATSVIKTESTIPKEISLLQNYPNPFNPSTVISFQLSAVSNVTLKVFDLLGREVATLVNETMNAGTYSTSFDASRLASGVYFYRIETHQKEGGQAGNFVQAKKMILLR